jgi:hypothetical protein
MLELIVEGTPRSLQGSRAGIADWKEVVRAAADVAYPDRDVRIDYVDVSARILHFCFDWGDNAGDLDNIAKPILDAIAGVVFFNDNQVTEVLLRRTDLERHDLTEIEGASPLLAERIERALQDEDPLGFVYIAVSTEVDHRRLR